MGKNKAIVLLSGGIDSTTLLALLAKEGREIHALSFDYGQTHGIELEYARNNAASFGVKVHCFVSIDHTLLLNKSRLTTSNTQETAATDVVPGRNLLFLAHAAAYAEANQIPDIFMAFNADDSPLFPDCRPDWVAAVNSLMTAYSTQLPTIKLHTPFIQLRKVQVLKLANKLELDLTKTLSCYQPIGDKECGVCYSCLAKKEAMQELSTLGNDFEAPFLFGHNPI